MVDAEIAQCEDYRMGVKQPEGQVTAPSSGPNWDNLTSVTPKSATNGYGLRYDDNHMPDIRAKQPERQAAAASGGTKCNNLTPITIEPKPEWPGLRQPPKTNGYGVRPL